MAPKISITWHASPQQSGKTIWAKLAERLGREPTNAEACAEVRRILADNMVTRLQQRTKRKEA